MILGGHFTNYGITLLSYAIWMAESTFGYTVDLDLGSDGGVNGTEVDLTNVESSSILLKIYIQTPFTESTDHSLIVQAPTNHRLFGFVQMARLRVTWTMTNDTSEEDEGLNYFPECVDYITVDVDSPNGAATICNEVSRENPLLHPPRFIGPRSFRGVGGRLELHIHTGPFLTGKSQNATMRHLAELAFTAYAECPGEEEYTSDFIRCSPEDDFSCIRSFLVCDNHTHCLFPESFGEDEKHCDEVGNDASLELDSSIIIEQSFNNTKSNQSSEGQSGQGTRWGNRRHRNKQINKGKVVVKKGRDDDGESSAIRNYFLPTAAIFFLIWGVVTLLRKCYRCYRSEYGKDEFYY